MERRAARLADYCQNRLGEVLRAVGYHSDSDFDVASDDGAATIVVDDELDVQSVDVTTAE